MIRILEKNKCCGCGACMQICPIKCIQFIHDNEGFFYPKVIQEKCINCGLCEKVCPYTSISDANKPLAIYAVKHIQEHIRLSSSSGGAFTALAEFVISLGGYVFGARFDSAWNVVHWGTNQIDGLDLLRRSKYVQSNTLNTYQEVKFLLNKGIWVLYCGTPCQILGLKKFLLKEYEHLILVDFVCHGVPSTKTWHLFLSNQTKEKIENINFRDKKKGWRNYTLKIESDNQEYNYSIEDNVSSYMKGFLKELYLRPSCHNCPAKSFRSGSDITLADYWWIQEVRPEFNDNIGCSLVYVNSPKGEKLLEKINVIKQQTDDARDIKNGFLYSGAVSHSALAHKNRGLFFENVNSSNFSELVFTLVKDSWYKRIFSNTKRVLRKNNRIMTLYKKHIKSILRK